MNAKKNIIKYSELFLHYKNLFTKKQIDYLIDYFLNDLSLHEIAKKYNLTTATIADSIKRSKETLDFYENNLHLFAKAIKRSKLYNQIDDKSIKNKLVEIDKI
ncbi:MAG: hypothetical protein LBF00_01430 [Mycoplasmataceae bacterium]|jgi:predicted DNA-binding protein YlxM (UPF0122 family)|nr:hypothetical protein [Mycoplasmataceae bacterium]